MKTLLNSVDYLSPEIYEAEQTAIFGSTWQFVGYLNQLSENDSWITTEIGGIAIFVQNCDGELKGFVNSCSHRFSRLRVGESGKGCIQCPYHGWRYNRDGFPSAIPSKPRFEDLSPERLKQLRLDTVKVDRLGPFIFASLNPEAPPVRDCFDGITPHIEKIGAALGPAIGVVDIEIAANWKLVVENTLEGYHLPWVHGDTFGKLDMGYPVFEVIGNQATSYAPVSRASLDGFDKINRRFQNRPYHNEGYFHTVAFPTFGLGTLYGMTFAVQRFIPMTPERTRLQVDLFGTKLDGIIDAINSSILSHFYAMSVEFSRKVCLEDLSIVELQQQGIRARKQGGILSYEEQRIVGFQRTYLDFMTSAPAVCNKISHCH